MSELDDITERCRDALHEARGWLRLTRKHIVDDELGKAMKDVGFAQDCAETARWAAQEADQKFPKGSDGRLVGVWVASATAARAAGKALDSLEVGKDLLVARNNAKASIDLCIARYECLYGNDAAQMEAIQDTVRSKEAGALVLCARTPAEVAWLKSRWEAADVAWLGEAEQ